MKKQNIQKIKYLSVTNINVIKISIKKEKPVYKTLYTTFTLLKFFISIQLHVIFIYP